METVTSDKRNFAATLNLGKSLAKRGKYKPALEHFRSALRLGMQQKSSGLLLRHVSECAIDCLELMEEYSSVLSYCDEIIRQYTDTPPKSLFGQKDLANTYLRRAVLYIKLNQPQTAKENIEQCLLHLSKNSLVISFADKLNLWLNQKRFLTASRLVEEQKRQGLFSVFDPSTTNSL